MYKIDKNVKNCRKLKITLIQVIHTERCEKGGKNSHFQKLSTLSTLKEQKSVDYLWQIKERVFCGLVIKITFCRKKPENVLTFKKSKFTRKFD